MGITSAVRVDLQLAGTWTNVTDHVLTEEKISISRGRSSETSDPQPSSATVVLDNRDGRFTPRNPAGTYYPNFRRNTPIRIGVGTPPQGAALGNQGSSVSIVAPAVAAESAGLAIGIWAAGIPAALGPTISVPAGYTAGTATGGAGSMMLTRTARLAVAAAGTVAAATATASATARTAGAQVFIPGGAFATSSGNATDIAATAVLLPYNYHAPGVGPFTSLVAGDVLVCCAAWSNDPNNAMLSPPGDNSDGQEWELVADSGATTIATAPRVVIWVMYLNRAYASLTVNFPNLLNGYTDTELTVYKVTGATAWNPRFVGQCSEISTASPDGFDIRTTVTCGSTLRKLGQGQTPVHSSLWRQAVAAPAIAYWPLEGGTAATALPSPTQGVPNATAFGGYTPGNNSTAFLCSDALGTFLAGNVSGQVPSYSTSANVAGGMFGSFQLSATDATVAAKAAILMAQTAGAAGTAHYVFLQYTDDTHVTLVIFDEALNTLAASASTLVPSMITNALTFFVNWAPNAANPTTKMDIFAGYANATTGATGYIVNAIGATTTVGQITAVWLGREPTGTANFTKAFVGGHLGAVLGQVLLPTALAAPTEVITSNLTPNLVGFQALAGWTGEDYFNRLLRIAQESAIPMGLALGVNAQTYGTTPGAMGIQLTDTPLGLIQLVADTDGGELFEGRTYAGLAYKSVAALSSKAAVATLDYSAHVIAAPLVPVDDDSTTRNDVTVSQQNGQSARSVVSTGTLGTLTVGDYTTGVDVSVYDQSKLGQIAAWLSHIGTVDEQRFTAVRVPLEATSLVQAITAIDIGQRITISNTPAWIQPGPSEELVIGYSELIGPINEWSITFVCKPFSPYAVMTLDDNTFGILDSNHLALNGT